MGNVWHERFPLDGYEEDGNPPALGAGNTAFDSRVPDMIDISWFKSKRSQGNGNCIEVGATADIIYVRDSKSNQPKNGPWLGFGTAEWDTFLTAIKKNQF